MTRLTLCLDDFGLHAGVNAAALELARLGRLDALSCLVGTPGWAAGRLQLGAFAPARVDVGLHLDLTDAPLRPALRHGLPALIARAALHALPAALLRDEIEAQLDTFEAARGAPPAHVDGHRHVHQLPQVRDALLAALQRRYPHRRPWLRATRHAANLVAPAGAGAAERVKPRVIEALGAAGLARRARAAGWAQNTRLLGVYGFGGGAAAYRRWLAAWLDAARDGDLLMCHAAHGDAAGDPLAAARQAEAQVLCGDEFAQALAARALVQGRMGGA